MLELGRQDARCAMAGSVYSLVGNLGSGKTHWTKGFLQGLESRSEVTSPTFSLVHEYTDGRIPVYHFDFYRIVSEDELIGLGWDEYLDSGGIIVVEWGNKYPALLPRGTIELSIQITPDGKREIRKSMKTD